MVESLLLATIHVVSTSWSGVYIIEFLALVLASIFPFLHFLFSFFLAWCLGYAHGFYDSYPFTVLILSFLLHLSWVITTGITTTSS